MTRGADTGYRTGAAFATRSEFYRDRRRKWSPEADYGVHWYTDPGAGEPWRVSYVRDTGEVYATPAGGDRFAPVRVLGVVPADPDPDNAGCGAWAATLDRLLEGWADSDATHHVLWWVTARLNARQFEETELPCAPCCETAVFDDHAGWWCAEHGDAQPAARQKGGDS